MQVTNKIRPRQRSIGNVLAIIALAFLLVPAAPLGGVVPTVGGEAHAYAPDCDKLRREAQAARDGQKIITAVAIASTLVNPILAASAAAVVLGLQLIEESREAEAEAMGCG